MCVCVITVVHSSVVTAMVNLITQPDDPPPPKKFAFPLVMADDKIPFQLDLWNFC